MASSFIFVADFDGTITIKDTIGTIAGYALSAQSSQGHDMSKSWDSVLENYSEDYSRHVKSYRPSKDDRKTLEEEITFYRSLKDVELRSFERLSSSGLFKGIGNDEWEQFGRDAVRKGDVTVRKGFQDFVEKSQQLRGSCGIVSVNIASAFIQGVLKESIASESSGIQVLANQPVNGVLMGPQMTGDESEHILVTSNDKLAAMKQLSGNSGIGSSARVVYVGDSGTDIECLMESKVIGIIMSEYSNGNLMETMQRLRVEVIHIEEYQEKDLNPIYWARDFLESVRSSLLRQIIIR